MSKTPTLEGTAPLIIKPDASYSEARWDAMGQFGLEKPSGQLSRDLEDHKRVLIQRGITIHRAKPAPDLGSNIMEFIASSDGIKRDGNKIDNRGWHFDNFSKNPVFPWCHDYRTLPIGKHVKWEVQKHGKGHVLRLWSQFCSADLYDFADRVRRMYEQGFLRAGSVGWAPIKYEPIQDSDGYVIGYNFLENDLLEFSAVPVPADPQALVQAIGRGILREEDMEQMKQYGELPKNSRDIAYTLSNLDPVEPLEIEKIEIRSKEKPSEEVTSEAAVVATEEATPEVAPEVTPEVGKIEARSEAAEEETPVEEVVTVSEAVATSQPVINTETLAEIIRVAVESAVSAVMTKLSEPATEGPKDGNAVETESAEVTTTETVSPEVEPEARVGKKVGKATRKKLTECNDCLDMAKRCLSELIDEDEEEDDEKEDVNDLIEDGPSTLSAEGLAVTRSEDAVTTEVTPETVEVEEVAIEELPNIAPVMNELLRKLHDALNPENREEPVVEARPSLKDLGTRLAEIRGHLGDAKPAEPVEPESEYIQKIREKLNSLRRK